MNLSCGNCKAIRSFSGNPPKCDVCGWVSGSPPSRRIDHWKNFKQIVLSAIGVLFALLFFGVVWTYWGMTEKQRLAGKYKVSEDKVFIEPEPHGCDFDDAPLGNKHCHYEKVVETKKACPAPDCQVTGVYVSWRRLRRIIPEQPSIASPTKRPDSGILREENRSALNCADGGTPQRDNQAVLHGVRMLTAVGPGVSFE